jgi:hypothetical protein
MNFGFILTRHVNSEQTNKYWNHSVSLINKLYPYRKIIIIDDNSDYRYVKNENEYKNLEIIKSEYPKRGELLPYIYFLKNKWFDSAVILHDSTFIHKRIPFERFNYPVIPFWHFPYDKENLNNLLRISSHLTNNRLLKKKLFGNEINILGMNNLNSFNLCFGAQCFIKYNFLELIEKKYKITNLVNAINNRLDRCAFERIIGLLFDSEFKDMSKIKSLFGNIMKHHKSFKYTYNDYINDFNNKKIYGILIKIWTGR